MKNCTTDSSQWQIRVPTFTIIKWLGCMSNSGRATIDYSRGKASLRKWELSFTIISSMAHYPQKSLTLSLSFNASCGHTLPCELNTPSYCPSLINSTSVSLISTRQPHEYLIFPAPPPHLQFTTTKCYYKQTTFTGFTCSQYPSHPNCTVSWASSHRWTSDHS